MAKSFMPNEIKNIIVLGHQGVGKTSMVEALLYAGKALTKKEASKKELAFLITQKKKRKLKYLFIVVLNLLQLMIAKLTL